MQSLGSKRLEKSYQIIYLVVYLIFHLASINYYCSSRAPSPTCSCQGMAMVHWRGTLPSLGAAENVAQMPCSLVVFSRGWGWDGSFNRGSQPFLRILKILRSISVISGSCRGYTPLGWWQVNDSGPMMFLGCIFFVGWIPKWVDESLRMEKQYK